MNINIRKNIVYKLGVLYLTFFFPVIASINELTNQSSNWISIVYRATSLLFAIYIIFEEGVKNKQNRFKPEFIVLVLFWLYYLLRLFYDLFVLKLIQDPTKDASYYLLQTIGISFINMLAFYFVGKKINFEELNKSMLWLFGFINVIFLFIFLKNYGFNFSEYATKRVSLVSEQTEIEYLNPITISAFSCFYLITIFYNKCKNILHIFLIFISLFNLVISASKGPFLSLVIVYIIFFTTAKSIFNFKTFINLGIFFLGVLLLFNSGIFNDFFLFERLANREVDVSTSIRLEMIDNAFKQILDNPIFGTHYFVLADKSSPHNIFVDIVLTTGVIGLIFFFFPVIEFLKIVILNFRKYSIFAIAFFTFSNAQTSGYVYGLLDMWALLGLVLAFPSNPNHNSNDILKLNPQIK